MKGKRPNRYGDRAAGRKKNGGRDGIAGSRLQLSIRLPCPPSADFARQVYWQFGDLALKIHPLLFGLLDLD